MHWHPRRVQNVLRPALTLMLGASLLFGLLAPALAIHQESSPELAGAWRGLTSHKNALGAMASIALILWCHAGLTRQVSWARCLAGAALATTCLLLSRSSTSLATSLFALAFMLVALRAPQALRRRLPLLVVLLLLLLALYGLAMQNVLPGLATLMAPITALSSKDVTLTGRTQIWAVMLEHIARHPLLGTGYGAYWTADAVPGTDAHEFITRLRGFFPGSAHNGYLDVTNDLGLLGLAALIGYIAVQARQCFALLRIDAAQATLYLALLFQQVITNLSETHWFSVLSLDFLLTTLTTTALARALLERRLRAAYGPPARRGEV
jgi:O-antigen ligase